MRIFLIAAMAGALIAGCSAQKDAATEGARVVAATMNAITPKDVGDGVTMTSVRADGATVVLTFEGGDPGEFDIPDFDRQVATMLCRDPQFQRMIADDLDMRIDFIADGGRQESIAITDCP